MKKAICLLSGGLDSATTLYYAKHQGYQVSCLIFDYGQRHNKEILCAKKIARHAGCDYKVVRIALSWQGSSLLDKTMAIPQHQKINPHEIPTTYVPARNIIFLSFAASYAEAVGAQNIFIGANAIDYSGYPDCRPEFFKAYQKTLERGLKTGVGGQPIKISTPLIQKTKAQIIRLGLKLKVPYDLTWSCYQGEKIPCGTCDSCRLRQKGFEDVGAKDPALKI
ncbi:MAG: 7-cyano-7-deazaguanine synthase QueC [Candidatus Omnitrophica bacterium]|nr:7-cyano-7-deazaguanine synthase QueC [Candidatus Omnitrophota bacterium]